MALREKTISSGFYHTLVIDSSGTVWSFGGNYDGRLGLGDENNRSTPTPILTLPTIVSVSAGENHSLFLDNEGYVWSCGNNEYNQLGFDDLSKRLVPERIPNLEHIVDISAGARYSLVLNRDGQVWAFGQNNSGKLGLGYKSKYESPTPILNIPPITAISAGELHSLLLDQDGHVWSFGANGDGQLGLGDVKGITSPEQVSIPVEIIAISAGDTHSLILDQDGHIWSSGSNSDIFVIIPLPAHIVAISASRHNICLDVNGQVWVFGENGNHQLGLGVDSKDREEPVHLLKLPPIADVAAGYYHSVLVDFDGGIWLFGDIHNVRAALGGLLGFKPERHPGLLGKVPGNITPTYYMIDKIRDQLADFRVLERFENTDVLMEFETKDERIYLVRVQYDPVGDDFSPPLG